jgi:PPM family protein phosphatase
MQCQFFSLTDTGRVRANNEDSVLTSTDLGLAILADGMGGYNAGEVASTMATQYIFESLAPSLDCSNPIPGRDLNRMLQAAVDRANLSIYEAAMLHPEYKGMGTTLVVALLRQGRLVVGHVGDSRAYRWRDGVLTPLTRDHSLLQEQLDAGLISAESARTAPYRNLVTRAMGVEPVVQLDTSEHVVQPQDAFLLCSDGLHDMLTDTDIAHIWKQHPAQDSAAWALLNAANQAGGRDNISLVLMRCAA